MPQACPLPFPSNPGAAMRHVLPPHVSQLTAAMQLSFPAFPAAMQLHFSAALHLGAAMCQGVPLPVPCPQMTAAMQLRFPAFPAAMQPHLSATSQLGAAMCQGLGMPAMARQDAAMMPISMPPAAMPKKTVQDITSKPVWPPTLPDICHGSLHWTGMDLASFPNPSKNRPEPFVLAEMFDPEPSVMAKVPKPIAAVFCFRIPILATGDLESAQA